MMEGRKVGRKKERKKDGKKTSPVQAGFKIALRKRLLPPHKYKF